MRRETPRVVADYSSWRDEKYTWEQESARLLKIYDRVLNGTPGPPRTA